jgi:hypothetical protein
MRAVQQNINVHVVATAVAKPTIRTSAVVVASVTVNDFYLWVFEGSEVT